jgi:hypothetical protein
MSKIVVAKLFRLGQDGDKFSRKFKTEMRSRVVIDDDYIKQFNAAWETRGQIYEIDQKQTDERDAKLVKAETKQEPKVANKPGPKPSK